MKTIIIKMLLLINLMISFTFTTYASGPGTTAANFLKLGIGSRATAMGDAFTAISNDGTAIYWNPAGLTQLRKPVFSITYNSHFADIKQGFLSFAFPLLNGTFAVGTNYVNMGEFEARDAQGNSIGDFSASDLHASIAYAHHLSSKVMFGMSVGALQDDIDGNKETAWLGNAGVLFKPSSNLSLGLVCQNIGTKIGDDPLPLTFKGGLAVKLESVHLDFDVVKPIDSEPYYCAGMELPLKNIFALRCGYKTNQDENTGQGISAGIGINIGKIQFDYTYTPWGDLNDSQKLSLSIEF